MYAENPQNVLTYFDYLQAVNTEKWEGWTPYYGEGGPVFYNGMIQSYLNVGPKAAAGGAASTAAARPARRSRSSPPSRSSPARCCGGRSARRGPGGRT